MKSTFRPLRASAWGTLKVDPERFEKSTTSKGQWKGGSSCSDGEIFQHLVDPFDDETGLLGGTVILARTAHVAEGAEIELRPDMPLPCFNGKDMGLAGKVLLLEGSEERTGNLDPEQSVQSGGNRFLAQELANSPEVRNSDFVDEIRLRDKLPPVKNM